MKFFALLALAASAAAVDVVPAHLAIKRDVEARATAEAATDSDSTCASSFLSAVRGIPTPPPDVASIVVRECTYTAPASVSSKVDSYLSVATSWYSEHSASVSSVLATCSALSSSYSSILTSLEAENACTATGTAATATGAAATGAAATTAAAGGAGSDPARVGAALMVAGAAVVFAL